MKRLSLLTCMVLAASGLVRADEKPKAPAPISSHVSDLEKHEGFIDFFWDDQAGKVWLEIASFEQEFLYVTYLSRGLGSNDVGLDRGQIGDSYVAYFRRIGPKVLMMQRNYGHRAESDDAFERRAVEESFAASTLWGFKIEAEENDRVLVDATPFLLRDAHDVVGSLRRSRQGSFRLDDSRSAIDLERTKNFTDNSEFEAILTFATDSAGGYVRSVTPTSSAVTIQVHHSLVRLPEEGYEPRRSDPRCGYFNIEYKDFATPISQPIVQRFIARHRLQKKDPSAPVSEPVEPIVYYVDRGAPEPIRSALVEGASWWNQAFEAAGFTNAFRVEVMPEGADMLDLRYNVIQWVHRSTRGWSYGGSVVDPRTGEILKGHVTLGSLRARQDYLIAEGLLAPYQNGDSLSDAMQEMALARIRQLSAHEVGHTLGLRHNFAASTNNRASVMDYPYPYVRQAPDGSIDLSWAYDRGIGEWDKATIVYGYRDYPDGVDADVALAAHLDSVANTGLRYMSDADARPWGSAHPYAHLWDNGDNPVDELLRLLEVRAYLLEQFSETAIPLGTPMPMLEETLVPIYLFHRYQIEAAAKVLGGLEYEYSVRGDGREFTTPVDASEQRRALDALLLALTPGHLALPEDVMAVLPPMTTGLTRPRETFSRRTGDTFDPLAVAESAAEPCLALLLHPERAARLVAQRARDDRYPGLASVIDAILDATWRGRSSDGYEKEIRRTVDNLALHRLFGLIVHSEAAAQVRAIASMKLDGLRDWLTARVDSERDPARQAHMRFALEQIRRFREDPDDFQIYEPVRPPAGSPIGSLQHLGCGVGR